METLANLNEKKLSIKDLLGCNNDGIIWGRLAAFSAAFFLSNVLVNLLYIAYDTLIRAVQIPSAFRVTVSALMGTILLSASIAIVFRFIRNTYSAILIATLIYSVLNITTKVVLSQFPHYWLPYVISIWVWTFLLLMALHIAVQKMKRTWLAIIIGYFLAEELDQIAFLVIYTLFSQVTFSLKHKFLTFIIDIISAAVFGGLFWAGLQLRWCKWQTAGISETETGTLKQGTESTVSFELSELKKVADTRMIKRMLRPAAIGSIIFGLIAVAMGSQTIHDNPINAILALIGVMLILEGTWCAVAPQPSGLIVDGIVLIILGVWNCFITFLNLSAGASGGSGGFMVLGIWQIILGVKNIKQYNTYAYISNSPASAESIQRFDLMAANINQLSENVDESIVEFQAKTLFKKTPLKGKLIDDMILFVDPKLDSYMDKIENVKLKTFKKNPDQFPAKASLCIGNMLFQGETSQQSLDRFLNWQAKPMS